MEKETRTTREKRDARVFVWKMEGGYFSSLTFCNKDKVIEDDKTNPNRERDRVAMYVLQQRK